MTASLSTGLESPPSAPDDESHDLSPTKFAGSRAVGSDGATPARSPGSARGLPPTSVGSSSHGCW